MRTVLAVYSPKPPITSLRFRRICEKSGYDVRFVKLGMYAYADTVRGKKVSLGKLGETYLLCGWQIPGEDAAVRFDEACEAGDRETLGRLLKNGDIAWVQLYTDAYDYAKTVERFPKDKRNIDASVSAAQLPLLRSAKSRYIFHNQGRRRGGRELMEALAPALAEALDGVVAQYVRPNR